MARLLCEAGADKDKADHGGFTALMVASYYGHLHVARLLCEAGADKAKANQDGEQALIWAGHLEVDYMPCKRRLQTYAVFDGEWMPKRIRLSEFTAGAPV